MSIGQLLLYVFVGALLLFCIAIVNYGAIQILKKGEFSNNKIFDKLALIFVAFEILAIIYGLYKLFELLCTIKIW